MKNRFDTREDAMQDWYINPAWDDSKIISESAICYDKKHKYYFIVTGFECVNYRLKRNQVVHMLKPVDYLLKEAFGSEIAYKIHQLGGEQLTSKVNILLKSNSLKDIRHRVLSKYAFSGFDNETFEIFTDIIKAINKRYEQIRKKNR